MNVLASIWDFGLTMILFIIICTIGFGLFLGLVWILSQLGAVLSISLAFLFFIGCGIAHWKVKGTFLPD